MQHRRFGVRSSLWLWLLTLVLGTGLVVPTALAQEATPVAREPIAAMTREEHQERLRQTFNLEAPANEGGSVVLGEATDIATLNPLIASDNPTLYITTLLFDTLVVSSPIDGQPAPGLADSWEVAPDGVTYTFSLNRQARWHDGTDVTADDVIFSLEAQLNPDTGSFYTGTFAEIVASYRAIDPDTVEIVGTAPSATFLIDLWLPIVPKHLWENVPAAEWAGDPGSTGQDPSRVVGSGPFRFREWVQGDHLTLERNPDYFGQVPTIDEFIFRVLPEDTSAARALEAGEIDIMAAVPPADFAALSQTEGVAIATYDTFAFNFYLTNLDPNRTTLFQDVRVRRALFVALDRPAISEAISFGLSEPAVGTHPPLSLAYAPDEMRTVYEFDPAQSRALLAEAGWTDTDGNGTVDQGGREFSFELITFTGNEQLAAYLQDAWSQIGLDAQPVFVEFPTLVDTISVTRDFEVALLGFEWDVTANQDVMFACDAYEAGLNVVKYCNPRYDELAARQRTELDPAKRRALLVEMANLINDDLPVGIIEFLKGATGYSTRLRNFRPNGFSLLWSLPYAWVEE